MHKNPFKDIPVKQVQDPETGEWFLAHDARDIIAALQQTGHVHYRDRIKLKDIAVKYLQAKQDLSAKKLIQKAVEKAPHFDRLVAMIDEGRTDEDRENLRLVIWRLARIILSSTNPPAKRGRYHKQRILRKIRLRETLLRKIGSEDPDLANALRRSITDIKANLAKENEASPDLLELTLVWATNTFRRLIGSYRIETVCAAFKQHRVNRSRLKRGTTRWESQSLDRFFVKANHEHILDFTLIKPRRKK